MNLFKKGRRTLTGILLAGVFAVSGCSTSASSRTDEHRRDNLKSSYSERGVRYGIDAARVNVRLGREKRRVPIHPDDAKFPGYGVVMGDTYTFHRFHFGYEWSRGRHDLRFKFGADARFGSFDDTMKRQNLPSGYESYGYSDIELFTLAPFVGLDMRHYVREGLGLSLELGLPYGRGMYEIGHHRWNRKEPIARYRVDSFGQSVRIGIYALDKHDDLHDQLLVNHVAIGLVYGYERYDLRFGDRRGALDLHSITLDWRF